MASTKYATYKSITGENQFTDAQEVSHDQVVQVSVYGKFEAIVSIQIRRPDQTDSDWRNVDSLFRDSEIQYQLAGDWLMRAGVDTGNYTSGTVEIEIS